MQSNVWMGSVKASKKVLGAVIQYMRPPTGTICPWYPASCHLPKIEVMNEPLKFLQSIWEKKQTLETNALIRMIGIFEVQKSLMGQEASEVALLFASLRVTLNPWKQMTIKKTKTVPKTLLRFGKLSRKSASLIEPSLLSLKKMPQKSSTKAPSYCSTSDSPVLFLKERGDKQFQMMVSAILIAMKMLVAELPMPQPFPNMSSSRMVIREARVSWITMRIAFPAPTSEMSPYIPDQVQAKAWPKAMTIPASFWAPSQSSFSSLLFWSTLMSLAPVRSCMIMEAVTMGEIPSSMRVPLLEAKIALIQQKGSDSSLLMMPQRGIWQQSRQTSTTMPVQICLVSKEMTPTGFSISGMMLMAGLMRCSNLVPSSDFTIQSLYSRLRVYLSILTVFQRFAAHNESDQQRRDVIMLDWNWLGRYQNMEAPTRKVAMLAKKQWLASFLRSQGIFFSCKAPASVLAQGQGSVNEASTPLLCEDLQSQIPVSASLSMTATEASSLLSNYDVFAKSWRSALLNNSLPV